MSNEIQKDVLTKTRVVCQKPGVDQVIVQKDFEYKTSLTMDVYYPVSANQASPAVIIVAGYPDPGHQRLLGCKFKETGSSVSWAQLIAASGIICITYSNAQPVADFHALLEFIHENFAEKIDANKIGVWASSGNVPLALSALIDHIDLKCAALLYGYMMDVKINEMSKMFGFVNPVADKSIDDLPKHLPMFIARAGQDETPYLNEVLDRFIIDALSRNMPITFANHPDGPHAFDLFDHSQATLVIIQQVLDFLDSQLRST